MVIFILNNIIVVLSSLLLTKIFFYYLSFTDFLLTWFTFFFAQIIIAGLSLGLLNQLYPQNVTIIHFLILLAVLIYFREKKEKIPFFKPNLSFIFNSKILILAISVFLGFFLVKAWVNLINPPTCPDSLQYHLSFPAAWVRNGNLNNPIVIFGSRPASIELTALTYYPINAEMFFLWLMLPLRNAFLADIGQAPFYFIGILAVYSILKKFSIKRETALLVSILWALIPNVFKQLRTGSQIDVICAVLLLLVLNNLLIMKRDLNFKISALFGISLGIFIGTKALNIFWFITLIPLFLYFIIQHIKNDGLRQVGFNLAIILLATFLSGSFSYIKTFIITGNPFFPVTVSLFGKTIFPGIIDKVSFSKLFVRWDEFKLRNMFFGEGLGLQFLALIFPGTIFPLAFFNSIRKKIKDRLSYVFLFFIPGFMFCLYLFYIKAYWIRYIFPYLAIGLISAVIFLDKFKWGRKYIAVIGFICLLSSAAELAHRRELIISLILSFLLFFTLLFTRKNILINLNKIFSAKTYLVICTIIVCLLTFLNEKYNREEFSRYPKLFKGKEAKERDIAFAWEWLNENTATGSRIAYTGRSEFYPLFGSKLKNDVSYIPINDKPGLPHYYADGLYRKEKNYLSWRKNLETTKVDYLFVALPYPINNESDNPEEFPIEDKWAQDDPKMFKLAFSNTKVRIYSIIK